MIGNYLITDYSITFFVPKLQTVLVESIAHPCTPHAVGGEALIVLAPQLFIFQRVHLPQFPAQIPGEGVDFAAFFDVFDDDGEVGAGLEKRFQAGVDVDKLLEERVVIADDAQVGRILGVDDIQVSGSASLFLRFRPARVEHIPVRRGGDDVINRGDGEA